MATIVYFDSDVAVGGRDGTTPATAYNDSDFSTYNFSKGTDHEFRFANGSVFTLGPTIKNVGAAAGNLKFTNYDRGDGHRTLPTFTCLTEYEGSPTWTEIDATDAMAGTYTASPGSKLWHCSGITGFIGAYIDDDGEVEWGKECDIRNQTGSGADAPVAQGDWSANGLAAIAGLMIYSDTNPNTYYAQGSRAILDGDTYTGSGDLQNWLFTSPSGGLEIENLKFWKCGFALGVKHATAGSRITGTHIHHCEFDGVAMPVSLSGSGSLSDGAGFEGAIIEHNMATNLAKGFISLPANGVALNSCEIRYNIIKRSCRVRGSGAIYLSYCYTSDESWIRVHHNWVHDTRYGAFWKADGVGLYSEVGSRDIEWSYNLVTEQRRAIYLKGAGRSLAHHNWCFAGAEATTDDACFVVNDTANPVNDLDTSIYQNVSSGFAVFMSVTLDFVLYPVDHVSVYRNIASGLDTNNNCNPIRSRATTTEANVLVRQNNFFGFWATGSITWKEYNGGTTTLTHTQADTSTTDNTALLAAWPEPDPDSTRNHALKLPAGITAAGATRGTTQVNAPCLAPA